MKRRLHRIFKNDGRTFIVALDHGNGLNVLPAMNDTAAVIKKCVAGGADAFLTTFGIANTFVEEIGGAGIILRIDGGTSQLGGGNASMSIVLDIESALRVGADAVICMGFPGAKAEEETLKGLARTCAEANKWQMPVGAEMLPRGFEGGEDSRTAENIALACRIGAEIGADFIKTQYTGNIETFKKVVAGCYKPIVILGGGKTETERDLLKTIKDSLEAGGSGVAIGRNIWRHPYPDKLCSAIAKIIHEGASVEAALKELN